MFDEGLGGFDQFLAEARRQDRLVVQSRVGFGEPSVMREALEQIRNSGATCVGTLTLDSYTRCGDYAAATAALARGESVNGYPLVSHHPDVTRRLLDGLHGAAFPVQVRHGTPLPLNIFRRMLEVGLDATEGGPVSYCMPYGRVPLEHTVPAWREASQLLADNAEHAHLESFGGCLLGQLCPPSLLIAVALLEGLFFRQAGIRSVSLSYAQGTAAAQDHAAIGVLRDLAAVWLPDVRWHVVIYTYMGLFPATAAGATALLADSARLARTTGCERLIVKTSAERRQIPSIGENVDALRVADRAARIAPARASATAEERGHYEQIFAEANCLIEAVMDLSADVGAALEAAFRKGYLDIPFCLHPDNASHTRAGVDEDGALRWTDTGALPFKADLCVRRGARLTADGLLRQLGQLADRYDRNASERRGGIAAPAIRSDDRSAP